MTFSRFHQRPEKGSDAVQEVSVPKLAPPHYGLTIYLRRIRENCCNCNKIPQVAMPSACHKVSAIHNSRVLCESAFVHVMASQARCRIQHRYHFE